MRENEGQKTENLLESHKIPPQDVCTGVNYLISRAVLNEVYEARRHVRDGLISSTMYQ